ncbi:MAG: aspartate aminotransferase family protein [Candidatus Nanopusillus acidilobi]
MITNTKNSENLYIKSTKFLAGGVNGDIKFRDPYPLFFSKANGPYIWDIDNNKYIDYNLSYGALILGHGHPVVKRAILDTLNNTGTILFGNPSPLEVEFAELLLSIYMKDGLIRLTNSGQEATLLAIRLAKAYTEKEKVGKFDGHYHGANPFLLSNHRPNLNSSKKGNINKEPDSFEIKGKILDDIVILPFNNIEKTKEILDENKDLAAIILEPFEDGYIPAKREFISFLRKYTLENNIVLIFDEVKTGFRIRIGGAVEYYNIVPDIICLGKIIGGGAPAGAVIGKEDIMNLLDPRKKEKHVFHSGTFNGNPLTMSLGLATIKELLSNGNFNYLQSISTELKNKISNLLSEYNIEHRIYGEGGIVNFTLGNKEILTYRDFSIENLIERKKIDLNLLKYGLYVIPGSRYSLSIAHKKEDIEETLNLFRVVIESYVRDNKKSRY